MNEKLIKPDWSFDMGREIIVSTLYAMTWLNIVEMREDDLGPQFRLLISCLAESFLRLAASRPTREKIERDHKNEG